MRNAFNRLWNDKRGNVLVLAAAALPMLAGAAGLATDTIQWALWKRELQRAADSAALAGVYQRVITPSNATTGVNAAVTRDLALNHHTGIALTTTYPKITYPDQANTSNRYKVKVELRVSKTLPFSSMFMKAAPNINASATAASVPGSAEYCVFAKDPSAVVTGLDIGGSTTLDMGECSLIANSANPRSAATNTGVGSTVKAKSLAAVGGVQYSKTWTVKSYEPYSEPAVDPFVSLPIPPKSSCNKTITIAKKDFPADRSTAAVADNGKIVCITGGLTVQGTLQLGAATYVIDGGDLTMNSTGSSLKCTGCTIILTNSTTPTATGNLRLTGGALSITAPTSGTYKGIALYQDRRATDDGTKGQNHVNGNSGSAINPGVAVTGVIYTPNRSLLYNGGGGIAAVCMQVIGKRITFTGNSTIKISSACAAEGLTSITGGRRVRLVA